MFANINKITESFKLYDTNYGIIATKECVFYEYKTFK